MKIKSYGFDETEQAAWDMASDEALKKCEEELDELSDLRGVWHKALRWSHDKPTVPGWYWMRYLGITYIVQVVRWDGELVFIRHAHSHKFEPRTLWAGPIPEPEE